MEPKSLRYVIYAERGKPDVLPLGKRAVRQADGSAGKGCRSKQRPVCNEPDRGSDFAPRESGQTSGRSFGTRKFEKPLKAGKQMTAGVILTGASAHRK